MSASRLSNIDGLRAIAAMAVFVQHVFGDILHSPGTGSGSLSPYLMASASSIDLGRFGVVLFFLISGFVVPFSIKGDRPLSRFAVSRVFRLYPVFWVALFSLSLYFWSMGTPPSVSTIAANMTMAPVLFRQQWLSEIYWTLFIELVFYIIAAALFRARRLFDPLILTVLGAALIASTIGPAMLRQHAGLPLPVTYIGLHLSFLVVGLLLRLALFDRTPGALAGSVLVIAGQLMAIIAIADFSLMRNDGFVIISLAPVMTAYVAAIAVFLAAVLTGMPQWSFLSWIGRISYSIYIFHWLMNRLVYTVIPLTGGWSDLVTMAIAAGVTLAVSYVTYTLVEKPAITLGKHVTGRLGLSGRPAPAIGGPARDAL